ncbi:MAG: hypothetical protein ACK4QW_12170, partial [Alphaproteobacteria bacterium]
MLLRTIIGTDMPDGMRRVREQLGDDAIIVQVEELQDGGVLLLAAADGAAAPAAHPVTRTVTATVAPTGAAPRRSASSAPDARREPEPATTAIPAAVPRERLLDRIAEALSYHRVAPHISERLVDAVEASAQSDPARALAEAHAGTLGFTDEPAPARAAPRHQVG